MRPQRMVTIMNSLTENQSEDVVQLANSNHTKAFV